MNEQPPPLEYQPPPGKPSWWPAIGGVLFGVFLTVVAVPAGIVLGYAAGPKAGAATVFFAFIPTLCVAALGGLLTASRKNRPFGLGVLIAIPVTLATAFVICGGMK